MMDQLTDKTKPGLRDYWQIFMRRKWIIILPVIGIVFIAVPGSFLMQPVYEASTILISQEVQRRSLLEPSIGPPPRGEEMNNVRYKIESRTYMKDAADKLDIAGELERMGKTSNIDNVLQYMRSIVTLRPRGSKIIEISARHRNPAMAKSIADTIAQTYRDKAFEWRQQTTDASLEFIKSELEVYKQRLRETEEALAAAQEKGVLDSLSMENNSMVIELGKFRADLVEVEMDLQEANGELQNARKVAAQDVTDTYSSAFYTNPEIASLEARLAGLKTQLTELLKRYRDEYPEVKKLKDEIISVQDELDKAKARFGNRQQDVAARLQYWEDRAKSLEVKRGALQMKISEYDRKLQQLPQRQLELARLRRDKEAAENTYSMLKLRLNEAELIRSSELQSMGPVADVLDWAIMPERPVTPNKMKIAVLALALGMIMGGGSAFLLEYFDRSFRSVDEIASYLGLPVLAAIPRLTTHELKVRDRRRRRIMIPCAALASLLALILIADIASAQFMTRDSFFMGVARRVLILLRSKM